MEISLISNKTFILNDAHRYLDDASDISKNYLNFCDDNLGQFSFNGLSRPPDLTDISNYYHQNLIPSIPNQNYNSFNRNLITTQNHMAYNSSSSEILSNPPFMSIGSYSSTNTFEQSMNSITNNNKNHMVCNTSNSVNPKGIFDNFHDLQENTIWDETLHNAELTNKDYEHVVDQVLTGDVSVPEGIKNTSREIINQHEDQKMHQKDNKKEVRTSKHLKKGNIIKGKWAESEDIKLKEMEALYADGSKKWARIAKKWARIAKKFEGRTGKQCRERWLNHLRPDLKIGAWSKEEDQILIEVHKVVGSKWLEIAKRLPRRSYNTIKNHWNSTKRRIQKQSDENASPADNSILGNYMRYVISKKDDISKTTETDGETTDTKDDDDDYNDMFYGEMNLNQDAVTQHTTEPLVDESTTTPYVPMQETFTWENHTTEFCEPMDDIHNLMHWWE